MRAIDMGLTENELPTLVDAWHQSKPHIVQFWWAVDHVVTETNGMVKAKAGNTTDATTYADWYKAVYVPAAESDAAKQSAAKPAKSVKE